MLIEMPLSNGQRCMIEKSAVTALTESNTAGCTRVYAGINMLEVRLSIDTVKDVLYPPAKVEQQKTEEKK
jgi:hypothetical protein